MMLHRTYIRVSCFCGHAPRAVEKTSAVWPPNSTPHPHVSTHCKHDRTLFTSSFYHATKPHEYIYTPDTSTSTLYSCTRCSGIRHHLIHLPGRAVPDAAVVLVLLLLWCEVRSSHDHSGCWLADGKVGRRTQRTRRGVVHEV